MGQRVRRDEDAARDPLAVVRALLDDGEQPAAPALGRSLLAGLDAEASSVRVASAWALGLFAGEHPDAVPALAESLADRVRDGNEQARRVLGHLADRHPDRVDAALADRGIDPASLPSDGLRADGGPGPAAVADGRQVVDGAEAVPLEPHEGHTRRDAGPRRRDADATTDLDSERGAADVRGRDGVDPATVRKRREVARIERSETFRAIRERSTFDDLAVVDPDDGGRYADTIRVRARTGSDERGVALGLLDRPEDGTGYADDVATRLARWQGASSGRGVLTVHDWGRTPRPWLATDPVRLTLAEWDAPDVAARLRCALALAEAVTTVHRHGVVHAGIDPGNVVFPDGSLDERPRPLLTNVALMDAVREHFSPSDYLDPRYAAPEYFDDRFGGVDDATDVYQLGAVVYRCLTDRAPFRGTYDEVREGVLEATPEPPTAHNASLPAPVDDVITKALAKGKLMRYETAAQLRADLAGVCERSGYSVEA